jgi:hypothetical protein
VAEGGAAQRREGGGRLVGLGPAAVLGVACGEDLEVAGRLRRRLGAAHGQVALGALLRIVEQLAQACLVGVEQVLGHRVVRAARVELALAEAADRDRGVGAGAREAGRGAELAQQQPTAGGPGVTLVDGRQRRGVGPAEDRRAQRAAGARQRGRVAPLDGRGGGRERLPRRLIGRRVGCLDARAERSPVRRRRTIHRVGRGRVRADDQLRLRVEQCVAHFAGRAPRLRGARARRQGERDQDGDERASPH